MSEVTVRAEAEVSGLEWPVGTTHTVERTPHVDAMIREGYVTEVEPDSETEPTGEGNLDVAAVAVPTDKDNADTWRAFLTSQHIDYTPDQAEDAVELQILWENHQK
jgi:hypothetical protein